MPNDITQTFTIDVGPAINALLKLDTQYKNHNANLDALTTSIRKFNRAATTKKIDALATSFNNINTSGAQSNISNLGAAISRNTRSGSQDIGKLTASLETLSRVVFTQFIVRGLSQIRNALRGAIDDSVEFQKQIALVQTIDNSGTGFNKLASDARKLSKSLGIDQAEIAAGAYQALGNQVGTTAESFKLLEVAGRFAEATGSTTAQAVDLLSGTLKSYNLTVDDAEAVAGKFFVALDKGRLTASELANTMGRTNAVAAELGVTIDEQNAFLSASTVTGTKAAEAITQLRALMSSFLKPSKGMSDALRKLGFDSGEAAIRALGLRRAVLSVSQAAGGTSTSLAKVFPNVRALTGVIAALDSQSAIYNETLRESSNSVDLLAEKYRIVADTDAKKFEKATNAISTAFSEKFGDRILRIVGAVSDFTGGAEALSGVGTATASAIDSIAIAVTLLAARSLIASERTGALLANLRGIVNTPLGAGGTILAGAPLAIDAGRSIGKKITDLVTRDSDNIVADAGRAFNAFAESERDKTRVAIAETEKRTKVALEATGTIRLLEANGSKAFQKAFKDPTKAMDAFIQKNQETITKVTQQRQEIVLQQKQLELFQRTAGNLAGNITFGGSQEKLVAQIREGVKQLSTGVIDAGELAKLEQLVQELQSKALSFGEERISLEESRNAVTLLREARQLQLDLDNKPSVALLDSVIGNAEKGLANATTHAQAMGQAIREGTNGALVHARAAELTAQAYERAAAAARSLPQASGRATSRYFGGRMSYFAAGGRGLDTIPAMLSPGEFVVNAKSTRKFFSQIQAINAGVQPTFRNDGGPVDNSTHIGDIHVHAAKNPQATADAVIAKINRAQRRGSAKLR